MSVGVVIQGPLVSSGSNGSGAQVPNFDCVANVLATLEQCASLGLDACVVTWDEFRDQGDRLRNAATQIRYLPRPVSGTGNKYLQYVSTLEGLRVLASSGVVAAIKVRSDQFVPEMPLIAQSINCQHGGSFLARGGLLVPSFRTWKPFSLDDFYFAGRIDVLEELLMLLTKPLRDTRAVELHSSVHQELFRAFAVLSLDFRKAVFVKGGIPHNEDQVELMRLLWNEFLSCFEERVWRSLQWRGNQNALADHGMRAFGAFGFSDCDRQLVDTGAILTEDSRCDNATDYQYWWANRWSHRLRKPGKALDLASASVGFRCSRRSMSRISRE